tara:strand:- start:1687 stop:3243 length:1557 start_codon:yes stop_codon:yes gene_type:complete
MVFLLLGTPLSGCFGDSDSSPLGAGDLSIDGSYVAGDWSKVTLVAKTDLSVYIPYFVVDPGSYRAQNGTVLDIKSGTSKTVEWLLPPRNPSAMVMIGDYGRTEWPVRAANESWQDWIEDPSNGGAVKVTENGDNGTWNWLTAHDSDGGPAAIKAFDTVRPQRSDLTMDDGVDASDGWVDGRSVYEWVDFITDDTPCVTCGADGAVGYLDRWIGNANPSYEHAITYFEGVMQGYGLDSVEVHRFQSNTAWAVNICGYKIGSVYPNEWLIFGAHFDIAPPVAYTPGAQVGIPGYGTRHGAYDNAAGSSMVLTTASVLAEFDARRTMVFCLWSSEEEGLWGSRSFANDLPDGVTVSNYLNLDMAGVNYPGDYALSVYLGPDGTQEDIDQAGMFHLAEWIGADALDLGNEMERGREAWLEGGESPLWGDIYEDTVAIYESPTARSDHDSFQNIGVATLGWNGLVDGYPCYHRECDTMETMIEYMGTEDSTGINNLVHSWDIVTWWAVFAFLHMDQTPVPNEL